MVAPIFTSIQTIRTTRLQSQRVLCWRLFLDDYSVKFHYINGSSNTLADALSRLPFDEEQKCYTSPSHDTYNSIRALYSSSQRYTYNPPRVLHGSCQRVLPVDSLHTRPNNSEDTNDIYHQSCGSLDLFKPLALEDDLVDCFLHLPLSENIPFILTYANIAQAQPGDAQLQLLRAQKPNRYIQQLLAPNLSLWCYRKARDQPWRIYLEHSVKCRHQRQIWSCM
jgi:hypothetical protein